MKHIWKKAAAGLLAMALVVGDAPASIGTGGLFGVTSITAYADETETLLTTITATGKEQVSFSTENVANVSFSYSAQGSSAYNANWGWWGYGWTATVTPVQGYTITKCVFYDDANRSATDSEAPFVVETTEEDKTPKVNGTPIIAYTSKGIKKIEVYGYATPTHTHSFTYSADGTTITATCTATGCTNPAVSATLTINAPMLSTYGGTESETATLTGLDAFNSATGKTIATTDIKYIGRDGTTYEESTTAPTDAGKYTAKITVEENTASVNYEIAKADPTAPTSLTATYGQTLANVTLPTGWTWADSTQSVGSVGSNTFKANFAGDSNYNATSNVDVTVTVSKASNPATVTNTATVMRGGNTVDLSSNVALNGATGIVSYEISGDAKGCSVNSDGVLTSGTNTGTVIVNVTVATDNNYEALTATPITVTISDKNTQTITANDVTATYGDMDKSVSATTDGDGAISYAVKNGSEEYISVDATTGALTINKVPADGKAYVIVTAAETQTYAKATKEVTITVNKASALKTAPSSKNPTRYSSAVQLINAGVLKDGVTGTIYYMIAEEKPAAGAEGWEPDVTKITADKAGTYKVWYKVTTTGDANYLESEVFETPVTVNVSQYTAPSYYNQTWTITMDSYEYDGTAHTPTINGRAYTYSSTQVQYTYYNADTDEELDGAPSAIGNYRVEVYADGGSSYYGRTQYATYSITDPIDENGMAKVDAFKENDTVPVSDGKIFAGWFTDETCTTAYTEDTGKAYAKFIDEKILTVKAQISSGTTANSASTSIRFITSVDSLKYQNVGFKITCNGKTIDRKMTKVYTAINAGGAKVKPTVFSKDSRYMEAYTLNNITKDDYDKEFTVTPYYTTQDGTIVEGKTNTFTIANMIK